MNLSIRSSFIHLAILASALFLFQSCGDSPTQNRVTFTPPEPYDISASDTTYTTEAGLTVHVIEQGDGPFEVVPRDQVTAYYTGRTWENGEVGQVFDSTYRNETSTPGILRNLTSTPINASGRTVSPLIDGFRLGIVGTNNGTVPPMTTGEKRVIIIPPSLGYGDVQEGSSGYSLRNDTLRFDIELAGIN